MWEEEEEEEEDPMLDICGALVPPRG